VDGAVAERLGERLVDETVLLQQGQPREARAHDGHLEVVAAAGAVFDGELVRLGKGAAEQGLETSGGHRGMVRVRLRRMEELGLFPLGIVLLPTERVPLHIFEPRYRELIGECVETGSEFGLVFADEEGVRDVGTRARVDEVLEQFDDGRMNVVVEGGERFGVERLTEGRPFLTAVVSGVEDDGQEPSEEAVTRASSSFRALATAAEADGEIEEGEAPLSFRLAAQVELAVETKQELLELRSEQRRLELVAEMLDGVRAMLIATRELGEHAKKNGSRLG
jgi:ATP-dependent Lon protease